MTDALPGFCFFRCCFIQLNKVLLLKIILEREAPYSSFVPSQLELTFSGHEPQLCSESSVLTRISVNVV